MSNHTPAILNGACPVEGFVLDDQIHPSILSKVNYVPVCSTLFLMMLATFILLLKRSAPFRRKAPAVTSSATISETGNQQGFALPRVGVDHSNEGSRPASPDVALEGTGSTVAVDAFSPPLSEKLPDGEHTVDFPDGTRYSGQWADGKMNGRGVLRWPSGEHYEGEWVNSLQQGQGTFTASDGSMYFGGWKNGHMDGLGVFKPAPPAFMVYLLSY